MTVKPQRLIYRVFRFAIVACFLFLTGCTDKSTQNVNLKYGNPSNAGNGSKNYLIVKPSYAISYSCKTGIANWASWQLNRSWIGRIDRSDNFRLDPELPTDCYAANANVYHRSGYDRGHLVPSGDRTRNQTDNSDTFLMTNIIPQSRYNNREAWRELEEYSRDLVFQGNELYLVAGGKGTAKKIARSKITVPEFTWKVILVLEQPKAEINADNSYTIAVWIPNSKQVANTDWRDYLVSIDEVEKKTGYNFFDQVPKPIQKKIEKLVYSYSG